MPTKTCAVCEAELPVSEFHRRGKKGLQYSCKSCKKEADAKRYQENKKEIDERNNKWKEGNPEKVAEQRRRSMKKYRPSAKGSASAKKYYQSHREKILENQRQYRKNNAEKISIARQKYVSENLEQVRESSRRCQRRRNAQKRNAPVGSVTLTKMQRLALQNFQCNICGCVEDDIPERKDGRIKWEEDHIIPLKKWELLT